MLTKKMLEEMEPGHIIATGVLMDGPLGLHMMGTGKDLRWVAVRGGGLLDWAIYCHWSEADVEFIRMHGDKVRSENQIRRCVACSDEVLKFYRN